LSDINESEIEAIAGPRRAEGELERLLAQE
jgi:hypothetical protein